VVTFLPRFLYEQIRKAANAFFLFIALLQVYCFIGLLSVVVLNCKVILRHISIVVLMRR